MPDVSLEMGDPLTTVLLWVGGILGLGLILFLVALAAGLLLRLARGILRFVFGSFLRFVMVVGAVGTALWTGLLDTAQLGIGALWVGGILVAAGVVWAWASSPSDRSTFSPAHQSPAQDPGGFTCPRCGVGSHPAFSCPNAP